MKHREPTPFDTFAEAMTRSMPKVVAAMEQFGAGLKRIADVLADFARASSRDGETSTRYFCRTHGEMLTWWHGRWQCPEHAVCGTWVEGTDLEEVILT